MSNPVGVRKKISGLVFAATVAAVAFPFSPALAGEGGVEAYLNQSQNTDMVEGFHNPPRIARPMAWMWWQSGYVSREGLTKDLECYAKNGMGGGVCFDRNWKNIPDGGVHFMSDEWRECFKHAVRESARLGLEISFHSCGGQSETGGPWITPEMSMKKLVWSRMDVRGGGKRDITPPRPASTLGYYEDSFLVAFPRVAAMPGFNAELDRVVVSKGAWPSSAVDGCGSSYSEVWPDNRKESTMDFFLKRKISVNSVVLDFSKWILTKDLVSRFAWNDSSSVEVAIQTLEGPDATARDVAAFTIDKCPLDTPRINIKFPETESSHLRLVFRFCGGANLLFIPEIAFLQEGEMPMWNPEIPNIEAKLCNAPSEVPGFRRTPTDSGPKPVVDGKKILVFDKPDAGGHAVLDLPAGEWTVLRFGGTTTGAVNGPAEVSGSGLESDKFSAEATKLHFDSFIKVLFEDNKEFLGKTLTHVEMDSWECKYQNWTVGMPESFERLRGYDMRKYAPIFAGFTVDNADETERFAFDFRRTCADLVAQNFFRTLRELCNSYGVGLMVQALYNWPISHNASDTLLNWGQVDIPMDEFWYDWSVSRRNQKELVDSIRESASACNAYDKRLLAAESFTSESGTITALGKDYWRVSPFENKDFGDMALVQGINRFVLHGSTHQAGDQWPGYLGSEGQKFTRNNPWFNMAGGFIEYYSRCAFLLQRGFLTADVLAFLGDSVPPDPQAPQGTELPRGCRSHAINADAFVRFAGVRDGKITLPNGSRFAVMVLPNRPSMDLASLKKIEELVAGGAVVLGSAPVRAETLLNYPACDEEVKKLAAKIWQDCDGKEKKEVSYGRGKIYNGVSLAEVLRKCGVLPDFEYQSDSDKRQIGFAHRRDGENEIYFIANYEDKEVNISAVFGSPKKVAELWNPEFGEVFPLADTEILPDRRVKAVLHLGRKESVFVVFRDLPTSGYSQSANSHLGKGKQVLELTGPWKLSFAPENMKAPAPFVADKLFRLDRSENDDVKFFSGFVTYETGFALPDPLPVPGARYVLSLGEVHMIGEVFVNGHPVGQPLWKPPYACDVTPYLKKGMNELKVKTVNYLANRLVGDARLPKDKRVTWMANPGYLDSLYKPDSPLMPSGLVGPVELLETK